jgi:hypothetical protein
MCSAAFKVCGSTLITDADKTAAVADRLAESHDNSQISPLTNLNQASCSVLQSSGFNTDTSTYTSPRDIRNVEERQVISDDAINDSLLKNISRMALVFLTYLFNGCLKLS